MSTKVTAKVKCNMKNKTDHGTNLSFLPDYQDGRNKEWAEATPALSVSMTVKNDVAEHFEQDSAYTLTFERNDE